MVIVHTIMSFIGCRTGGWRGGYRDGINRVRVTHDLLAEVMQIHGNMSAEDCGDLAVDLSPCSLCSMTVGHATSSDH
ncbi:hypothetical protein U1707_17715 [Sphingomonas sp. PB2P12]